MNESLNLVDVNAQRLVCLLKHKLCCWDCGQMGPEKNCLGYNIYKQLYA